jgi:4-amino-4-deoxy-L-arabinose transferase-like glycosyltransferase
MVGRGTSRSDRVLVTIFLAAGVLLRAWGFPHWPPGLNQDELSSTYEAYSLLRTGADRWGNPWPIYFPSWGSGQSVLLSYLTIPVVAVLGLSVVSVRIVSLLAGVLTLPVFYQLLQADFDRRVALWGLALLAFTPWHVMMSRWGLECNLLPFMLALGLYTVHRGLRREASTGSIVVSLVPWGLAYYTYGLSIIVIPTMVVLVALVRSTQVKARPSAWTVALGVHIVLGLPFLLFLLKNHVLRRDLGFESLLPITIPLLPVTRLEQVGVHVAANLQFLKNGFNDGAVWNSLPGQSPLLRLCLPAAALGIIVLLGRILRLPGRMPTARPTIEPSVCPLVLIWLLAPLPLIVTVHLGVHRFNAFFLPFIAISAYGLVWLQRRVRVPRWKVACAVLLIAGLAYSEWHFLRGYFKDFRRELQYSFMDGLGKALVIARDSAGGDPILVSDRIRIAYMHPLFHLKVEPSQFQKGAVVSFDGSRYVVHRFQNLFFDRRSVAGRRFVYVMSSEENTRYSGHGEVVPCAHSRPLAIVKHWRVARCPAAN